MIENNMKKILVILWFGLCAFLFVFVDHPQFIQRLLPSKEESVQNIHNKIRPLFYRVSQS